VLQALRGRPSPERDRGLVRMEAFSDGVFSIAITLLVLDIHVPEVEHGLAAALAALWPRYVGYVLSFVVIGIWWANHHELCEHFAHSDHLLMLLNTLLLMCIGFMPFATALLSQYLPHGDAELTVAAAVYVGTLLLAGLAYNVIWRYAVRAGLLDHALTPEYIARRNRMALFSLLTYALALALVFASVPASLAVCFLVAVYYARPGRRRTSHAGDDPAEA
jgi:uncharacterized membrane protein